MKRCIAGLLLLGWVAIGCEGEAPDATPPAAEADAATSEPLEPDTATDPATVEVELDPPADATTAETAAETAAEDATPATPPDTTPPDSAPPGATPAPTPAPTAPPTAPAPVRTPEPAPPQPPEPAPSPPPEPTPVAPEPTPEPAPPVADAPTPFEFETLETRLRETRALGVFTKLELKNQIGSLLDRVRDYHERGRGDLAQIRESFDLLVMKVMTLLQDKEAELAAQISQARAQLWSILADPDRFAKLEAT